MKIKLYLLSIALPIIIYSCERSIDMKLPYSGDKIVVNAVMKSDSMLIARITRSLPPEDDGRTTSYDSTNARELKTVDAEVYEDGVFIEKLQPKFIFGTKYYISAHLFKKQKKYSIKASSPGLATVVAEDVIPENTSFSVVKTDKVSLNDGEFIRIILEINDPFDRKNFYRVRLFPGQPNGKISPYPGAFTAQGLFAENNLLNLFGNTAKKQAFFSDDLFNGKKIMITLLTGFNGSFKNVVEVAALSQPAFQYLNAKFRIDDNYGNPFVEPVNVYNNIVGGYGIFCGMNIQRQIAE